VALNVSKYLAWCSIVRRRLANGNSASFFKRLSHDGLLLRVVWPGAPGSRRFLDANLGEHMPTRLPGYRPKTGRKLGAPGYHTDEEVVS
jgi:hypothetical protein